MTLLMYELAPDRVMVLMDTLATNTDGTPNKYVTKVQQLPHMQMVIACTGIDGFGERWAHRLSSRVLAVDIEMLDQYAPTVIAEVWSEMRAENDFGALTSTIYHFGQSRESGEYVGFAYRSAKDFVSERLPYGFGVKPAPAGEPRLPEEFGSWVDMAITIRQEQDRLPLDDRIHVGGALVMTLLQQGGQGNQIVYEFEDHAEMWNDMVSRLVAR
jgi:hypothetical protein